MWRTVAWVAVSVEMIGVLSVGTLSLVRSDLFADATVWSDYGQGYGYVPLVLPFIGMWWLRRTGSRTSPEPAPAAGRLPACTRCCSAWCSGGWTPRSPTGSRSA